mmetsp:Transcript_52511/g.137606  ORF Transcript_52511/g.137606 Transcript_52511/m.137606 type:complete len:126 (+) Transcript_52511:1530-1907(+)
MNLEDHGVAFLHPSAPLLRPPQPSSQRGDLSQNPEAKQGHAQDKGAPTIDERPPNNSKEEIAATPATQNTTRTGKSKDPKANLPPTQPQVQQIQICKSSRKPNSSPAPANTRAVSRARSEGQYET